ncbi:hypothetical protein FSP39_018543 [Pinctada imbricata]|uniref:rRNA adenine N(6)-methyltransferase n=1 Tax=Pinctada imbricata TaxID=66713 RepID=A0AA88XS07_PINIB|nr:hypothetical protein FSP39_018543 [Pinctada imbricata]
MGSRFPPLPTVSDLVRLYKLRAKKQLSQNFLLDMNLCHKLVKAAGDIGGAHVCEVGPGPGGITRAILQKDVQKLSVIELDKRFLPSLEVLQQSSAGKLDIHMGNIMKYDMESLFPESSSRVWNDKPPNIHIIGNLPFNVSTPLIIQWLEQISNRTGAWKFGRAKLTLTFQHEVARRIVADINTEDRCRLSIMCQYLCDVNLKFVIPGSAFVPPPKVDVGVVRFVPKKYPIINLPFKLVEKVTQHLFHYRQKKCIRGAQDLFPVDKPELVDEMFQIADIDPSLPCFKLGVEEVGRLCHVYQHICQRYPFIWDYNYRDQKSVYLTKLRQVDFMDQGTITSKDEDEKGNILTFDGNKNKECSTDIQN